MCSSVANGPPDRNRDYRQTVVAIITIRSLPHRCQCNPRLSFSDLVTRIPNGGVAQGSYHPVFLLASLSELPPILVCISKGQHSTIKPD